MKIAKAFIVLLAALAVVQTFYYYPILPNTVASHFDGAGRPNDWMTKQVFFGFYLGMIALMLIIFFVIPRFPKYLINIPNRNYWLATERRAETMKYVDSASTLIGVATMILIVYVFQLAIEANFSSEPILSSNAGKALIIYFIFLAIWLIKFIGRFWKVPSN